MNTIWLMTSIVGGTHVLLSYILALMYSPNISWLRVGWGTTTFKLWAMSALIAAFSFLYVLVEICFFVESDPPKSSLCAYLVFLFSAHAWAPLTLLSFHNNQLKVWVIVLLVLTAISSIVLTVTLSTKNLGPRHTWIVVMSVPICLHCTIWDGVLWNVAYYRDNSIRPSLSLNHLRYPSSLSSI